MSIGETVEDVIGSINVIEEFIGLVRATIYGDVGYEFRIRRIDKGGKHSMPEIKGILRNYGVATFWYGFSGGNIRFRVKKRQARWAEYVLLHAGVELLNPAFDHRNASYAAKHAPGWMPRPWSAGPRTIAKDATNHESVQEPVQEKDKGIVAWLDSLLGDQAR